ncbi:hypothetical protein ILYODFUR_034488 [Ilyodon furcidens]|uniref:Uncharacterized protein n=1 Tax=Ilyodon furcidens TaxID=33524 RepID=A0ABV0TP93_9TELE
MKLCLPVTVGAVQSYRLLISTWRRPAERDTLCCIPDIHLHEHSDITVNPTRQTQQTNDFACGLSSDRDISSSWLCSAIQACLHHHLALFSGSNEKAVRFFFPFSKARLLFSVANSDVK